MAGKRKAASGQGTATKRKAAALPTAAPPTSHDANWKSSTHSHGGGRTGSFSAHVDESVRPHTLILGTQPSNISIAQGMYFGNDANCFWPCVGEALGFRRGFQCSATREDNSCVPSIEGVLTPEYERVTEYSEAMLRLTRSGFALWDILESSERKGSLDSAIRKGKPADIEGFVRAYPTVWRIVFATGKGSAGIFKKHFLAWLQKGGFVSHASALEVFGEHGNAPLAPPAASADVRDKIELIVPPSVSPACATISVAEKIQSWKEIVFNVAT